MTDTLHRRPAPAPARGLARLVARLSFAALLLAPLGIACEGDLSSADISGGFSPDAGGPAAMDVEEQRRDLTRYFVDGQVVETIDPVPPGHIPEGATEEQIEALERVNWYRWKVGLLPVDLDLLLSQAAQAHSDCYVEHTAEYSGGMSAHMEDPSWGPPCTGQAPWDRTGAAGVVGWGISEVIAFTGSATSAVDGWAATLYHRLPIVDPTTKMCGYGERTAGNPRINVMNCAHGELPPDVETLIRFPWDGAEDVPVSWDGFEDPQPPEPPTGYPSGPIITLTLPQAFLTVTHELVDEEGNPVEHMFLDFQNDPELVDTNTVCLYSYAPLADGVTYTVRLQLDLADAPLDVEWSFTTRDNPFE